MCSSLTFSDSAGSVQSQRIDIIHHTPFITSAAARLKGPVEIPAQSCCVLAEFEGEGWGVQVIQVILWARAR